MYHTHLYVTLQAPEEEYNDYFLLCFFSRKLCEGFFVKHLACLHYTHKPCMLTPRADPLLYSACLHCTHMQRIHIHSMLTSISIQPGAETLHHIYVYIYIYIPRIHTHTHTLRFWISFYFCLIYFYYLCTSAR